jgi:DNA-binding response OmpR family regulator
MAKKILLVDDDQDLLKGISVALRSAGYEVVVAEDSITAVSTAVREKPDLAVIDIGLPGGDGFLLMSRLRNLSDLASTPIIVVSARPAIPNRDEATKAGALAFFQKPVDRKKFMSVVRLALARKESTTTL